MLNLIVSLASCDSVDPSDTLNVYSNIDAVGNASGDPSATPENSRPVRLFPGVDPSSHSYAETLYAMGPYAGPDLGDDTDSYGERPYAMGPYADDDPSNPLDVNVELGPVHFGLVKVACKAVDKHGNEQSGAMAQTTRTVNSTPTPASRFTRGSYAAGQQAFSFRESPQLVA